MNAYRLSAAALLFACACASTLRAQPRRPQYDLLIQNGAVIDGSGAPRARADVAITGDRIVRVSPTPLNAADAARTIDARGLIVAPGFIDLHAHLDPILSLPDGQSHVRQGVTLALGGPDGGGPWPFGAYLDSVATRKLGMNVAFLAGHNSIRRAVLGSANRAPTNEGGGRLTGPTKSVQTDPSTFPTKSPPSGPIRSATFRAELGDWVIRRTCTR